MQSRKVSLLGGGEGGGVALPSTSLIANKGLSAITPPHFVLQIFFVPYFKFIQSDDFISEEQEVL